MRKIFYEFSKPLPEELITSDFILRPLASTDINLDFEAYIASPRTIKIHSMRLWEIENFSLEDDLELLRQHEERHLRREDFAFIILSPKLNLSLGCVYLLPLVKRHQQATDYGFDVRAVMVTFWTRDNLEEPGFSTNLVASIKQWLKDSWEFSDYVFRINSEEIESKQALEENGLNLCFKVNRDNSHTLLFYRE